MNAQVEETHVRHKVELAQFERQIRAIVEAIKDGLRTAAMKDELLLLEVRKQELSVAAPETPATAVRLHPNLAEIYRQKVARLHEELNRPELREEAAAAIRGLIEEVRLVPVEGKLELELAGALAGILALTSNNPRRDGQGLQVTLVAGPATTFTEQPFVGLQGPQRPTGDFSANHHLRLQSLVCGPHVAPYYTILYSPRAGGRAVQPFGRRSKYGWLKLHQVNRPHSLVSHLPRHHVVGLNHTASLCQRIAFCFHSAETT